MPTVLLVGHDDALADALTERGFVVTVVDTGAEALGTIPELKPDLVLLDLILPDADGLVVLPRIKDLTDAGLIVCSARQEQADRVLALKLGADDFIPKPVDIDELTLRCSAVLNRVDIARRNTRLPQSPIVLGDLSVLPNRGDATVRGQLLHLTRSEYCLLEVLARQPGSVITRAQISEGVWGHDGYATAHAIDVLVGRVRKKLLRADLSMPSVLTRRDRGFELHYVESSRDPFKEGEPD